MVKPRLYIFIKAPFMGMSKTRLARDIGPVLAQKSYRSMCQIILKNMTDPRWETILYVTPDHMIHADLNGLWPRHLPRRAQTPRTDLGARISACFDRHISTLVIGTDTPDIQKSDIVQAFACLGRKGAVFGPAEDGGFYLMGMAGRMKASPLRHALQNVRWSHANTLADVKAALSVAGVDDIHVLRPLRDVDDGASYRAVIKR